MHRVLAAAAATAAAMCLAGLLTAPTPGHAAFSTVTAPFAAQHDLVVGSGGRLMSSVPMADGSLIVADTGPPVGTGYLHRVRAGQQLSDANRLGPQLDIISLAWRRGALYGILGDQDSQGYYPLVRLDPATGQVLATLAQWTNYQTQMLVDPLNGRLVMQDGGAGAPIVELDPDTGQKSTLVARSPSANVEGMAFDASGQTFYLGNSFDNRGATGTVTAGQDGVYAYDRGGGQRFFFAAEGSPDGLLVGRAGTCFAGQLLLTTEQGHVFLVASPSATTSPATMSLVASTPVNGGALVVSSSARGNPIVSHDGEVTELECPVPSPPTPAPPAPPPPPPAAQPAPAPAAPARPAAASAPQGQAAPVMAPQAAPAPAAPPAPPAPGLSTAAAPVAQPAVQAATQAVSQAVSQTAPAAGLADVPDEQHSIAFSGSLLDAPLPPALRLLLGAGAVTGMAGVTWVVTGRRRQADPAAARLTTWH